MSRPNEPTDPNKQTIESVSLPQIPIPSPSQLPSTPSSSSSCHPTGSSFLSSSSPPSLHPLPLPSPPPLSLASLEVVPASESHTSTTTNEENPKNSEAPHTEVTQDTLTPPTPLSLTIPLLAFTTHQFSAPLLDCGFITFTLEELVNASYDSLVAKVIVSIEKILLSQNDEAQRHAEWVEWMEGSTGGGIGESELDDIGRIGLGDTLTRGPLGNLGSGVGELGLRSALRREKIYIFRGGALEVFGQKRSKGLRDKKDQKRRWEFRIYEDPVDGKPGESENAEMRDARILRQARKRLETELAIGRPPVRECVGENQENEEMAVSRPIQRNENVGEIEDEIDEDNPHPQQPKTDPSNPPNSSLPPPTQSRTPLSTLSPLPKNKEYNPITIYIHWKPEPLIPTEYNERTTRMRPIVGSASIAHLHPATPGDDDGGCMVLPAEDERKKEEEEEEEEQDMEQIRKQEQETSQAREINLTILHPSFPTHEQFTDRYGAGDSNETDSEGIRELLRFLRERGGKDELIVEYLLL
ncbi:uncharacterized protein Bfra_011066 [Botrytis fragariae]|uniref:Uncharacterized protein n=1 Tax=Botrytis fragariae TaxID=1964551 RepID=A0A8H6EF39_9HELO|nr:uncharacterized protein Bfra_011066 [Botrytis fragariae]KAF5869866.1 hypothetical protein Bfra_011066 [Botrytis fragariae]